MSISIRSLGLALALVLSAGLVLLCASTLLSMAGAL
jgi:hypothetical protein